MFVDYYRYISYVYIFIMYTLYTFIYYIKHIYIYIRIRILNIEMRSNNIKNAKPKKANQPTFPERLKKSKQGQTRCQLWVGCGAKPVQNGSFFKGYNNNDNDNKDNKNNNDRFFVLKYQFFWYLQPKTWPDFTPKIGGRWYFSDGMVQPVTTFGPLGTYGRMKVFTP